MRSLCRLCVAGLLLAAAIASGQRAGAQGASISELRAQLDAAGDRRDHASEEYNRAHIRRQALDARLVRAQADLASSEAKLAKEREKLGVAARNLYMHPAAGLGTFFQAKSYGELERGAAFAGRVLLSTDTLILRVRKARAEQRASANYLKSLRDQARAEEARMDRERRNAEAALTRSRQLLNAANGELARIVEAERRAGLASAASWAAQNIKFAGSVKPGAQAAVRYAMAQEGKPYQWGGAGPGAYDCSGLTMMAWAQGGVSLPHNAAMQRDQIPSVPISQLAPGDLVFRGSPPWHVGIYKGGGVVIHAPHTGTVIQETSLASYNPTSAGRP